MKCKVLIASICNLGACPCLWCTLQMVHMPAMGTPGDMSQWELLACVNDDNQQSKVLSARRLIYKKNYAVNPLQVEAILKNESLISTSVSSTWIHVACNISIMTQIECFFLKGFVSLVSIFFCMLVVDLMHEFELGVWKAILTQLIHIVESIKGGKLHKLDRRHNILDLAVPTTQLMCFTKDIIRSLHSEGTQFSGSPRICLRWKGSQPTISKTFSRYVVGGHLFETFHWVGCQCVLPETTNELHPLKGLTRLLTSVEVMRGGRESLGLKSLIQRSYWGNSKRTWLKFSGGNFGLYILLIIFVHDCMGSTDTVCIR